jgi:2-C-methyl-D-erythritol 4-phosphate cytidylyltransferase
MRYHALIPSAGKGTRFQGDVPKQYWVLEGKPILVHGIERLAAVFPLEQTYVAVSDGDRWCEEAVGVMPAVTLLRCGGATRADTVRNALSSMTDAGDDDWVLVHDAVRPCVDVASLCRLRDELADDAVGGLLAVPVVGTLKRAGEDGRSVATESREGLWSAQTPQMFRCGVLRRALARKDALRCTDEAQAVEALGMAPRLVMGDPANLKITYPGDLVLAAAIFTMQRTMSEAAATSDPARRDRAA